MPVKAPRACGAQGAAADGGGAMRRAVLAGLAAVALVAAGLGLWRAADRRADRAEAARLEALQPSDPARFDPAMVAGLPEPARRYLLWAIRPGTPLRTVATFGMRGQFSMGTAARPAYMAMTARQTLAAPHGLVWSMDARRGLSLLSGSDSARWTRFWVAGIVPVARMGGTPDHILSAYCRMVAEAVFWSPAAVLPGPGIAWSATGPDSARVTISQGGLSQAVDLNIGPDGTLRSVVFARRSNANPAGVWQDQPFGGTQSGWRAVQGFRVPTHVEAGSFFGTPDYFAFYVVDVGDFRFP